MDGENHGKPYFLMDDLGVPLFLETPASVSNDVTPKPPKRSFIELQAQTCSKELLKTFSLSSSFVYIHQSSPDTSSLNGIPMAAPAGLTCLKDAAALAAFQSLPQKVTTQSTLIGLLLASQLLAPTREPVARHWWHPANWYIPAWIRWKRYV